MKLEVVTPEKVSLSEEVYEVMLPTQEGQITVMPGHEPLITLLTAGVVSVRIKQADAEAALEHVALGGGFAEITGDSIKVLADRADRADDLDDLKIQQAKEQAQRQLSEATDSLSYADAVGRLQLELAREKVRNLKRRHRTS